MKIVTKHVIAKSIIGLMIGVLFIPFLQITKTFAQDVPQVVINELAWTGSSVNSRDEWIELKNTTDQDIDLTGWQITKDTSENNTDETGIITIEENLDDLKMCPSPHTIPAGGYYLIAHNSEDYIFYEGENNEAESVLNIKPDCIKTNITLSNIKLSIKLYNGDFENGGELVDIAGDGEEPLAGNNDDKTSMERKETFLPGDEEESWHSAILAMNLDSGPDIFDLATPENSKRVIAYLLAEPQTGNIPLTVTFNASETIDFSNGGLTFEWDFESEENNFSADATTETPIYEHTYASVGSFLVGLRVINDANDTNGDNFDDTIWLPIEITEEPINQPPGARFSATPLIGTVPLTILFNAEESSDDEGITEYRWDFGDGEAGEEIIIEHTFNEVGNFIVELTVKDIEGFVDNTQLTVTVQAPEYSEDIIINELYPQPNEGSSAEFIELHNQGEEDINLKNWQLDDIENGGSVPYTIVGETIILAGSYRIFSKEQTKISLNDSGDLARLVTPNNEERDRTANYDKALKGQSYSLINDKWLWTETPTPNSKNIFTITEPPTEDEPDNQQNTDTSPESDDNDEATPEFESGDILISELLPNPSEMQEFIELYNPTEHDIDLQNWKLKDASGKTHTINNFQLSIQSDNNTIIEPNQYIIIVQDISNIYLNNNGGESVMLLDPSDNEIDFVAYPDKALKDVAYVLMDDGGWTWANPPTPAAPNIVVLEDEDEPIVVAPISSPELPPSGPHTRIWWGIAFISFGLSAIVFWIWENKRIYGDKNCYHRFAGNLQTR